MVNLDLYRVFYAVAKCGSLTKAAEELYDVMWDKLSKSEQYCPTGNYLEDVKRINAMKQVIEEEILSEIVYV